MLKIYLSSFRAKWVEIHGVEYRIGCVVRLAEMSLNSCQDYPLFAEVAEILVWEDEKIFVVNVLDTVEFNAQYMAYQVQQSAKKDVKTYHGLPWHGVLHKIQAMESSQFQLYFCANICIMAGNLNNANNRDIQQVISHYLKEVVEDHEYFTGWIDGEINLNEFLREYEVAGSTSFKLRSSAQRSSANRYGNEGT